MHSQKIRTYALCFALLINGLIAQASESDASPRLQTLSPEMVPVVGTFYLLSDYDQNGVACPPYPYNPCPEANVSLMGNGKYLVLDVEEYVLSLETLEMTASSIPLPGDDPDVDPVPQVADTRRNYGKFMHQAFLHIDTNQVVLDGNVSLYNLCNTIPQTTNTGPDLQIIPYGTDAVIIKANSFDFSAETSRDFALVVSDTIDKPILKAIDLVGSFAASDGWLIQGTVNRSKVTSPMFLMVTNIAKDCSAFFRAVPYSGPQVTLSGIEAYSAVSNSVSLSVDISDLSGVTNNYLDVTVDGIPARYSVTGSNTISLDTRYCRNGYRTVVVRAYNQNAVLIEDLDAPPMDTKLDYDGSSELALEFANATSLYWPSDFADPSIGTNYMYFEVTPPHYLLATITEPSSGRVLKSVTGFNQNYQYVSISWNFTESDGSTYTNDDYVISFSSSSAPITDPNGSGVTTLGKTNKIERAGVRTAKWAILQHEHVKPSSYQGNGTWINTEMDRWSDAIHSMYKGLYFNDFASQTQYYPWQIGSGRNIPSTQGFRLNPYTESTWRAYVQERVTNRAYSDFNYGPGHGNGHIIGGGEFAWSFLNYVNTTIEANEVLGWAQAGSSGPNGDKKWRMRKVTMWSCYSARMGGGQGLGGGTYGNWHYAFGINPHQLNTLSEKNVGLYFNEVLYFYPYGSPATDVSEVAAELDKIWVMGANPYPGGAEPNYSFQFAFNVTSQLFPELLKAGPVIIGCPFLPFAGVYDNELKQNDYHQVKP